ncbi:unnamed protein product [Trichogramma brassicae]|uniref:Uncharacterized protein n=1 Tax=Trichogramma brassicae TaxID=86971 RepID=A0A6H5ICD2_9HYME|nr:unnamed protein product [Trichogramma brassicae]
MSCSVKQITSAAAKSWSSSNGSANPSQSSSQGGNGGSASTQQLPNRRINSLAEEVVVTIPGNTSSNASPQQQQQPQQLIVAASAAAAAAVVANNAATQSQIQQRTNRLALAKKGEDTAKLLRYIDDNVVGKNGTFLGPFGRRKARGREKKVAADSARKVEPDFQSARTRSSRRTSFDKIHSALCFSCKIRYSSTSSSGAPTTTNTTITTESFAMLISTSTRENPSRTRDSRIVGSHPHVPHSIQLVSAYSPCI